MNSRGSGMSAPSSSTGSGISGISSTTNGLPPGLPAATLSARDFFFLPAPGLAPPRPPVLLDFVGKPNPPSFCPSEIALFLHEGMPPVHICSFLEIMTAPGGQYLYSRLFHLSPIAAVILLWHDLQRLRRLMGVLEPPWSNG